MYTRHSLVKIQLGHLIQIFFRIIGEVGNLSEPKDSNCELKQMLDRT